VAPTASDCSADFISERDIGSLLSLPRSRKLCGGEQTSGRRAMAKQSQQLNFGKSRGWQAFLAVLVIAGVGYVVVTALSSGGTAVTGVLVAVSMSGLLLSSMLSRREITGRW
jgi:hypothetical protein